MLMVESVNGTPNCSAARAARISPSGYCMPVKPVGASATGMLHGSPSISQRRLRPDMFTITRCRSLMAARSSWLAR